MQRAMLDVLDTGNLTGAINHPHPMHLYRSDELLALLRRRHCKVVAVAAANFLSLGKEAALADFVTEEETWRAVLSAETVLCEQPGALDGGSQIIAVVRRP